MKKKKIDRVFILSALLAITVIFLFVLGFCSNKENWEELEKERFEQFNRDDATFLVYGEKHELSDILNWEYITDLNEETLLSDHDFIFLYLVDRKGEMKADVNTFRVLKEIADKNMNFNFLYFGSNQLENIKAVFPNYQYNPGYEMSFGYHLCEGGKIMESGNWTRDAEIIEENGENYEDGVNIIIYLYAESVISEYKKYIQLLQSTE